MGKLKRTGLMALCLGASLNFMVGCGNSSEDNLNGATENEEISESIVTDTSEDEVEEVFSVPQIEIPENIGILGQNRLLDVDKASAFANAIESVIDEYEKAVFINTGDDDFIIILGHTESTYSWVHSENINLSNTAILQWNGSSVDIIDQNVYGYMTDILEEGGLYSIVYSSDLRQISDVPEGYSTVIYDLENGIKNDKPTSINLSFTNANSLTKSFNAYTSTKEEYLGWIIDPADLTKLISVDEMEQEVINTNTEYGIKTYVISENGDVFAQPVNTNTSIITEEKTYPNSILSTINQTGDKWHNLKSVVNILKDEYVPVDESVNVLDKYQVVLDTYKEMKSLGASAVQNQAVYDDELMCFSYNNIHVSSLMWYFYLTDDQYANNIGYALLDINNDGIEELVMCSKSDGFTASIIAIYGLGVNDEIVTIIVNEERTSAILTSNLELISIGSGGYNTGIIEEYKFVDGVRVIASSLYYYFTDQDAGDFYYYGIEGNQIDYTKTTPTTADVVNQALNKRLDNYDGLEVTHLFR